MNPNPFAQMHKDIVTIVKAGGRRLGPYKTGVSPKTTKPVLPLSSRL